MLSRKLIGPVGVLILFLGLASSVQAQSDQMIYGDSLGAGWQDWSWCSRDLGSTDVVHSGSRSARVTYTAAYQGFYLRHIGFDSTHYTTLTFWINGGGSNGRSINVAAQLNDTSQSSVALNSFVEGGGIAAGAWRKVTIPLSALGVSNAANLNGFWLQDSSGSPQPAFYVDDISLAAAPPPSLVNVSVDANNVKRTVDARVFGVAAAIWDSQFATPSTISLLTANRTRITRFPGGSLSNNYHWSTNTTDSNTWQWATSFDEFASVALAINAQAFISVNYGTGTAQEAADWVRYSNITKGYGFKFWEIGNENYGSWETDSHPRPHDAYSYATLARDYINAMKAVDPTIKVGVVVNTGENSYANYGDHPALNSRTGQTHNGWTPVLLSTMRSLGVTPDFVIYHKYEQQPGQEDDSTLLQAARTWVSDAADLRQQLNDYLGVEAANIEIVATENNSVSSRPGKQTTSLVNGLYYADSVGQVLQTEFNAFTWWILRNGRETNNNNSDLLYGWRQYGDYGMVSGNNDPYPAFYISKLVSNYLAAGGDQVVSAASDYSLLSAYAVKRGSGELALMVINKSPASSLNASISLTGIVPLPNATIYFYGIPQDEAARTGTGSTDIATSAFDGAASSFNYTFPPYSATVIALATGRGCSFSVEAQFGKFKFPGGSGEFTVTSDAGCGWQASSDADWITITAGDVGIGNGVVSIAVAPNTTGGKRKGRVTIAGQVFKVTQKG